LHRVVAVRVLVTLRAVVAGVRELATRLQVKGLELVRVLARAAAEAVALVEVDAVYVCFRAHTRSV
jgi:hypothetical protein